MSRHLENLRRLGRKMQDRYGHNDELVRELERDIAVREAQESRPQPLSQLPLSGVEGRRPAGSDLAREHH